jgi:hypothetical protein
MTSLRLTIFICTLGLFFPPLARPQTDVYLKLSTSERRPLELAVAGIQRQGKITPEITSQADQFIKVLSDDLSFSLYFLLLEPPGGDPEYGLKRAGRCRAPGECWGPRCS